MQEKEFLSFLSFFFSIFNSFYYCDCNIYLESKKNEGKSTLEQMDIVQIKVYVIFTVSTKANSN